MQFKFFSSYLSFVIVGIGSMLLAVFVSTKVVRPAFPKDKNDQPVGITQPNQNSQPEVGESPPQIQYALLEPYVFDISEGRRNPFRPPQFVEGVDSGSMVPGTALENFEIDELKLAGILWDVHSPKAMIIDPQGEVHILGKDDRIGRKRGYIAVIREGEVVIVENTTFNGESTYATRIMRIEK